MKFFLSSTYEDLKGMRRVAINTLEDLCCQVEAMEYFEASTRTNKEVCLSKVRQSDLLIGIYGRRYGTIDKETGLSFTELEYIEAKKEGIPILGFVLDVEPGERDQREETFIRKIFDGGKLCAHIDKKSDFVIKLNNSLVNYFDGLEGYDYSGIWTDIQAAERKISSNLTLRNLPAKNDVDKGLELLTDLALRAPNLSDEDASRLQILVAYLKLNRLKDRLLHEPWTEELRKEVLVARDDYLKIISGSELLDVVDEKGNPTGKIVERKVVHQKGLRHRTSHLWILRNKDGHTQVLLQKRSEIKDSFPGCYDISSAGHIPAGDDFAESALRELFEELGIKAEEKDLHLCGRRSFTFRGNFRGKDYFDNQISNVYEMWLDKEIEEFTLQKSEVEALLWMDLNECKQRVAEKDPTFPNCIWLEELEMLNVTE